jgi:hypothetical protein
VFPTHIDLLHKQLKAKEICLLKQELERLKCKLNYDQREMWIGDQWLQFFKYAPFAYQKPLLHHEASVVKTEHYETLITGCKWMAIMLRRPISQIDIRKADLIWKEWFEKMPILFTTSEIAQKANFHNTSHLFDFACFWGPPVCYWARPFEHKHKTFKRYIQQSNHKNELQWCAKQECIKQSIRFVYPHFAFYRYECKDTLMKDSNIIYQYPLDHSVSLRYGIVQNIESECIVVAPLTFDEESANHSCPKFTAAKKEAPITILKSFIISKFELTDGYVNIYALLNSIGN